MGFIALKARTAADSVVSAIPETAQAAWLEYVGKIKYLTLPSESGFLKVWGFFFQPEN